MTLRLNGSTSGYVEIDAPATAGSNTLVLPTGNGSNGQVLSTNGSGALSWVNRMTAAGPAFYANANGSQTLAHNTETKLTFTTPIFDTNSCFNTSNSRFTPNVNGIYLIRAQCSFVNTSGDAVEKDMAIRKNGTAAIHGDLGGTSSHYGGYTTVSVFGLIQANGSSDYFEIYAYQFDSDSEAFSVNTGRTYFSACLVREL